MRQLIILSDKDVQTIVDGGIVKQFQATNTRWCDIEIMSESTYKKEILKEKENVRHEF